MNERKTLLVNLEEDCQLNCVFCQRNKHYNAGDKPTFRQIVSEIIFSDCETINFSGGGEPTRDKNLRKYIQIAKKNGFNVLLETNGIALSDLKYFSDLVSCGLDKINLNVPSHCPKIYEKIVQTPGSFEKLNQALNHTFRFPGIIHAFTIPLTNINMSFKHFRGLFNFLSKFDSHASLLLSPFRPNDDSDLVKKYLPDYEELGKNIVKILEFCKIKHRNISISNSIPFPLCKLKKFEKFARIDMEYKTYYDFASLYTKFPECQKCSLRKFCIGIPKEYLKMKKFVPEPFDHSWNSLH